MNSWISCLSLHWNFKREFWASWQKGYQDCKKKKNTCFVRWKVTAIKTVFNIEFFMQIKMLCRLVEVEMVKIMHQSVKIKVFSFKMSIKHCHRLFFKTEPFHSIYSYSNTVYVHTFTARIVGWTNPQVITIELDLYDELREMRYY